MNKKNKRLMTLLLMGAFLCTTLQLNAFYTEKGGEMPIEDPRELPNDIDTLPDNEPAQSGEVSVTDTAVRGNSTSFHYNESHWTTDTGTEHINTFNITNDGKFTARYVNASVSNLKFGNKTITFQDGDGNDGAGTVNDNWNIAQEFKIESDVGDVYLRNITVKLSGYEEGENLTAYIYSSTTPTTAGGKPDTAISQEIKFPNGSVDLAIHEFNYTVDDDITIENDKYYYLVMNKTNGNYQWRYHDDGSNDGMSSWYNQDFGWTSCIGWLGFGSNDEFIMTMDFEPLDNLDGAQMSDIKVKIDGTEKTMNYISDGHGYAEFTDPIAFDAHDNIQIDIYNDTGDWNLTFDYSCEYILTSNNQVPILPQPNDWMWYRTHGNDYTTWRLDIPTFDSSDNNSVLINLPYDWTNVGFTPSIDERDMGSIGYLARLPNDDIEISGREPAIIERITWTDAGRESNDWHQPSFNATIEAVSECNTTFSLFYKNGTLMDETEETEQTGLINYSYTFDKGVPRDDYTLVATFFNGTSADSISTNIELRYLIGVLNRSDLTSFTLTPDDGHNGTHYYAKNNTAYTAEVNWDGDLFSRGALVFDDNATLVPVSNFRMRVNIRDENGISFNATARVYDDDTDAELYSEITHLDGIGTLNFSRISTNRDFYVEWYFRNGTQITDLTVEEHAGYGSMIGNRWEFTLADGNLSNADWFSLDPLTFIHGGDAPSEDVGIDDGYEGNNGVDSAKNVTAGSYGLVWNDDDYFNVTVLENETFTATITYWPNAENVNLSLALYNDTRGEMQRDDVRDDVQGYRASVSFTAEYSANYTLSITRNSGVEQPYQDYTLTISIQSPTADNGETDDDDDDDDGDGNGTDNGGFNIMDYLIYILIGIAILAGSWIFLKLRHKKKVKAKYADLFEGVVEGGKGKKPPAKLASATPIAPLDELEEHQDAKRTAALEPKGVSNEAIKNVSRYFDDVTNTRAVMGIQRESGTSFDTRVYPMGGKLNPDLISGFLNAITSFQHEVGNQMGKQVHGGSPTIQYGDFTITMLDGTYITIALINDHDIGANLTERVKAFIDEYEGKHLKDLKDFSGSMSAFADFKGWVDSKLDGRLNLKSEIDIERLEIYDAPTAIKNVWMKLNNRQGGAFFPAQAPGILMRELHIDKDQANWYAFDAYYHDVFKPIIEPKK